MSVTDGKDRVDSALAVDDDNTTISRAFKVGSLVYRTTLK